MDRVIIYRGSVSDLATDIAYEITPEQARQLIAELQRLLDRQPAKFQNASARSSAHD